MTKTSLALVVALGTLATAVCPVQAAEPYTESPSRSYAVRSTSSADGTWTAVISRARADVGA